MSISIDFETYAAVDLKKVGAWRYAEDSGTRAICLAVETDTDAELIVLDDGVRKAPAKPPEIIMDALADGGRLEAWNSFFEWCVWRLTLNWPALPIERWHDTAAQAAICGLPRGLGDCAVALGLPDTHLKDSRGKELIQLLCSPEYHRRNTDPELLAEMYAYCEQDAKVEREVGRRLPQLSTTERAVWELDQTINIRGVRVDTVNVGHAIAIADAERVVLDARITAATRGAVTAATQRQRVIDFVNAEGAARDEPLTSLTKKTLPIEQANAGHPPHVAEVLTCREFASKTSVAKYNSLDMIVADDSRAHGLLLYHGAHTGRWTGRLFQPQNLPRGEVKDTTAAIGLFKHRDRDLLDMIEGEPMTVLSGCVRGMLIPSELGGTFAVCDYAAIEARVLAWLAGQQDTLEVFRTTGLIYEHTAARIFRVPVDAVTSEQRFAGKVAVLALGFQGGHRALISMAENYGATFTEREAHVIKNQWREANRSTVQYWYDCEDAVAEVVSGVASFKRVGATEFRLAGRFLIIKLPSGRKLRHYAPRFDPETGNLSYMGVDSKTKRWRRKQTYGGDIAQTITQATARDLMADAMLRTEAAGGRIVLTVHDELVAEDITGAALREIMLQAPAWAAGIPIDAEADDVPRYVK